MVDEDKHKHVRKEDAVRVHIDGLLIVDVHAHVDAVLLVLALEHVDVVLRVLIDVVLRVLIDVVLLLLLLDEIEIRRRSRTCTTRMEFIT